MQPVYKGGNKLKTDPASYRGIYLSSALAKTFEGILLHRLTQHDTGPVASSRLPAISNFCVSSSVQREYRGRTGAQPRFDGGIPSGSPSFGMPPQILAVKFTLCSGLPPLRPVGHTKPKTAVGTHAPVLSRAQDPVLA